MSTITEAHMTLGPKKGTIYAVPEDAPLVFTVMALDPKKKIRRGAYLRENEPFKRNCYKYHWAGFYDDEGNLP